VIWLTVLVEGDTEEAFVKAVLRPHLEARAVYATPIKYETSRNAEGRRYKGGGLRWAGVHKQLREFLRDPRAEFRLTTLFDLYGLPSDFPGMAEHAQVASTAKRAESLEVAMATALGDARFIPYIQRHEFESLVLACLDQLEASDPTKRSGITKLRADINAPASRLRGEAARRQAQGPSRRRLVRRARRVPPVRRRGARWPARGERARMPVAVGAPRRASPSTRARCSSCARSSSRW
jgi:hypothetical protein